jgi:hypothetical protein
MSAQASNPQNPVVAPGFELEQESHQERINQRIAQQNEERQVAFTTPTMGFICIINFFCLSFFVCSYDLRHFFFINSVMFTCFTAYANRKRIGLDLFLASCIGVFICLFLITWIVVANRTCPSAPAPCLRGASPPYTPTLAPSTMMPTAGPTFGPTIVQSTGPTASPTPKQT